MLIRNPLFFLCLSIFSTCFLSACGKERSPGSSGTPQYTPEDSSVNHSPVALKTSLSSVQIQAGNSVHVSCELVHFPANAQKPTLVLSVQPSPVSVVSAETGWDVAFEKAGPYKIFCATEDNSLIDPTGVSLEVSLAAPVDINTVLASSSIPAGTLNGVVCEGRDRFANKGALNEGWHLVYSQGVEQHGKAVSAARVGGYAVMCATGSLTDTTPAVFSVTPGAPAVLDTSTSVATAQAGSGVEVGCRVFDAYQNEILGTSPSFQVSSDAGPVQSGLTVNNRGFSATKAGLYFVYCRLGTAVDTTPSEVTYQAGLPFRWEVSTVEDTCLMQSQPFPVEYFVFDYWDNLLVSPPVFLGPGTSAGVSLTAEHTVGFVSEGSFDMVLQVSPPYHPGASLAPYHTHVNADSTGPRIVINQPARGAHVVGGTGAGSVQNIAGTVEDHGSAVVGVVVEGVAVTPASNGSFNHTTSPSWGLNTLSASATDACGNVGSLEQSYLRSAYYYGNASNSRITHGISARLAQGLLDDQNRTDTDDLATLGESIVGGYDLNTAVPDPLKAYPDDNYDGALDREHYSCGWCPIGDFGCWSKNNYKTGFVLYKRGTLEYTAPHIEEIQTVPGGIRVGLSMGGIHLPFRGSMYQDLGCLGGVGPISMGGDAYIDNVRITVQVNMQVEGQNTRIEVCPSCVQVEMLCGGTRNCPDIDIDWGDADFLSFMLDPLSDALIDAFMPNVSNMISQEMRDRLPVILGGFLESFQLQQTLQLPSPLTTSIQFQSNIDQVLFASNPGYVQMGMSAQVSPTQRHPLLPANNVGSIGHGISEAALALPENTSFGISISDDVINQALWAFWQGGGLHITDAVNMFKTSPLAAPLLEKIGNAQISTRALLPPVLMSGAENSRISFGLGDFWMDASLDIGPFITPPSSDASSRPISLPIHVVAYLNAKAEADVVLEASTNQLSVRLISSPVVKIEIVDTDIPGQKSVLGPVLNQIFSVMLPHMLENAFKTIPIPSFDIGSQLGLAQPVVWTLQNGSLQHHSQSFQTVVFGDVK